MNTNRRTGFTGFNSLTLRHAFLLVTAVFSLLLTPEIATAEDAASDLEIKFLQDGPDSKEDEAQIQLMEKLILEHPVVVDALKNRRYRVLSSGSSSEGVFELGIYDYDGDRFLVASGKLDSPGSVALIESDEQPAPSQEEFDEAVARIGADPSLGAQNGGDVPWNAQMAMPATISGDLTSVAGYRTGRRVIPVDLLPKDKASNFRHEIVGVDLVHGKVIRFPEGAPPSTLAVARVCSPPSARQEVTRRGTQGRTQVQVNAEGVALWEMEVVRPSASSGTWGSGVEIRNIRYRGKKVLSMMNAPIATVRYDRDVCGPFRDWAYSESAFRAEGERIAPGIISTSAPARTIFETGSDFGNFRGVAVYKDGSETVLVSEMASGWYRYKTEYRFHKDGTIRPRFGFTSVQGSCTCLKHVHHAYFRFDFDVEDGKSNRVQVSESNAWQDVTKESKWRRRDSSRHWRVIHAPSGAGYEVVPGDDDGTADSYGRGDLWLLRFRKGEIDDDDVKTGTAANLDAFLNGEGLVDQDLVVWYAVHMTHVNEDTSEGVQVIGPQLRPVNWQRAALSSP